MHTKTVCFDCLKYIFRCSWTSFWYNMNVKIALKATF